MIKQLLSNKIIKNFSVLTATNIFIQLLSILTSIRLARLLQPAGYGLYNLLLIQGSLFSIIAAFGLHLVIIRYVARNRSDSKYVFGISIQIRIASTLCAILILFIYNIFINKVSITPFFLFLLSFYIIFLTFWDSVQNIAFGNERMESAGYLNLLFTCVWVIAVYAIPKDFFNIDILLSIFIFIQILKTFSYYFWLKKKIFSKINPTTIKPDINYKSIIKQSKYFFILAVMGTFQTQLPVLMLNQNSSLDQVGIFNLGYRILSPLQMVLNVALTSLYPYFSRLAFENKELFVKRIKNLLNLIVVLGVWCCICFSLFSREVVLLLYGNAYLSSAKVILIQCWSTLLFAIFSTIGTVLSSFDKQRMLAILSIVHAFIAISIYYWGTKYGAIGLAWAFVISAYLNLTYHWIVFKNFLSPYITISYLVILSAIIILFNIGTLFVPFELSFTLKIVLVISVTLIAVYYLKNKELKIITSYLRE
jgi:O-antigen/teichoic acid export membrane protein